MCKRNFIGEIKCRNKTSKESQKNIILLDKTSEISIKKSNYNSVGKFEGFKED